MAKTWKELEAEGVKRCCAMFKSGKRCARRADVGTLEGPPELLARRRHFCKRCGPKILAVIAANNYCGNCGVLMPLGKPHAC